ncbi:argininosuccinate lyase [Nioella sp. MMSF_3534]|nr:argininosuccinate lyase [Nioella sp. MMSF_3534]
MTRLIPALIVIALLTACGVDGSPTHPEPRPEPGISISGTVEIGVAGGN